MRRNAERVSWYRLERVHFMPKELKQGVLYMSDEFRTAAHLCACGCGAKVRTPLGPAAWSLEETEHGPTLDPSVENWQKPCRSHYWITGGKVLWCRPSATDEIAAGRKWEEMRREAYYRQVYAPKDGALRSILRRVMRIFRR